MHGIWSPELKICTRIQESDLMHSVFGLCWLNQLVAKWKDMIGVCITGFARSTRMPLSNGQPKFAGILLSAQAQSRQPRKHPRSVVPERSVGLLLFAQRRAGLPGRLPESRPTHLGFSGGAGECEAGEKNGTPPAIEGQQGNISPQRFAESANNQTLDALRASESRYRRLFETTKDGILILDLGSGEITDVNPFVVEMLGYTHSELVGKKLWEIGPFKDIPACRSAFTELQTQGYIRYEDLPLETKHGRSINVEFVSNVYTADNIQVVQCNIRDITERARAAAAIRLSETRHRSVFEGALHGIYRGTLEGAFLDVNPALVTMLGYGSAEEVLKFNVVRDVFAEPEKGLHLLRKWRASGEIEDEVLWKRRDQRLITVRLRGRVLGTEHQPAAGLEVIAEDVTEQRALEGQLRQTQRIEAMGQLAGGMAHEFNNYLGIIMGYSELLLEETGASDLRRNVAEIKAATHGAASLTRQLLALSRQQVLDPKVLDINTVVWETQKLLRRLIPENIELVPIREQANLLLVKIDPAQIQQVLINLVINARDAMPQGGKVIIETANVDLDKDYAGRHLGVQPGRYVMLAVSDNGSGIEKSVQAHMFEPFFTTKLAGKGTGLGLSTVYGIVRQSGGHIAVESTLEKGTSFRIYLPPGAVTELNLEAETSSQPQVLTGTETVLVVEDESALRNLLSASLEKQGYALLVAGNGTDAMQIIENHSNKIDLVVSDIMMPKMNGLELRKKTILLRPEIRFLFMSGYSEDTTGKTEHFPHDADFLAKPFLPIELVSKVRTLLNKGYAAKLATGKTA